MTPADLDRVAEWAILAEAATPGAWEQRLYHSTVVYSAAIKRDLEDEEGATVCEAGFYGQPDKSDAKYLQCDADASFIAAAREAVPEMARMIRDRDAALATYEQEVLPTVHAVREMADRVGFDGPLDAFVQRKIDIATEWEKRALAALAIAERAAAEVRVLRAKLEGGGS